MERHPARLEAVGDDGCLADFRRTVERLRSETVSELGRQPMQPEKLAAIVLVVVSLPLILLVHPMRPSAPAAWQIVAALLAVWGVSFQIQRARYDRFHTRWRRKVAAHAAVLAKPAPLESRFRKAR